MKTRYRASPESGGPRLTVDVPSMAAGLVAFVLLLVLALVTVA